jgi:hypothetical protein
MPLLCLLTNNYELVINLKDVGEEHQHWRKILRRVGNFMGSDILRRTPLLCLLTNNYETVINLNEVGEEHQHCRSNLIIIKIIHEKIHKVNID